MDAPASRDSSANHGQRSRSSARKSSLRRISPNRQRLAWFELLRPVLRPDLSGEADAPVNADPMNMTTTLRDKVIAAQNAAGLIMPFELRHGYPMNVNRPFGNGVDDSGNLTVDEIYFNGTNAVLEDFNQRAFVDTNRAVDGAGNNSIRDNFPQYGQALSSFTNGEYSTGNGAIVDPRVLYARHLYCSAAFMLTQSGGGTFQYGTAASNPTAVTLRRIAQWAINCAEFRDPDGIMTAFEYDTNLADGWDVNGDPKTMVDPMGNTVAGTEPTAGLVWGCEQPELLLTETMLLHERRVADTNLDPSGRTRSSASMPDTDLDQVKFPQGSLYLELYCPRPIPTSNPVNLVRFGSFPPELYNVNAATGAAALALDRMAPPQPGLPTTARPIWRIGISDVLKDRSANTFPTLPGTYFNDVNNANRDLVTYQPEEMVQGDVNSVINIEREIWFTSFDPVTTLGMTATQAQGIFYNRLSTTNALQPGGYLVIGPRSSTPIGTGAAQAIQFQHRSNFTNPLAVNDLEVLITDTTGTKSGGRLAPIPTDVSTGNGNVQPFDTMICAANLPTNWSPGTKQSLVVVRDAMGNPSVEAVGVNATMPLPELTVNNPALTYWDIANEPDTANEELMDGMGMAQPKDIPIDEDPNSGSILLNSILQDQLQSTATFTDYKAAFLQRLANPLLPWNPVPTTAQPNPTGYNANLPLNPYLTVDWMPLDLTVFNGEDRHPATFSGMGEWDPYDGQPAASGGLDVRFGTREKGLQNAAAPYRNPLPWTFETTEPPVTTEVGGATSNFRHTLRHTLGFLNDAFTTDPTLPAYRASKTWERRSPTITVRRSSLSRGSLGTTMLTIHLAKSCLFPLLAQDVCFTNMATSKKSHSITRTPVVPINLGITLRASSADYNSNPGSLTFPNGNYLPFPHLLNFFQVSKGLTVSGGTATYSTSVAPNFSRTPGSSQHARSLYGRGAMV